MLKQLTIFFGRNQVKKRAFLKGMFWLSFLVFFLSGCKARPKVKPQEVRYELSELNEFPFVHDTHRGKKMTPDMKPTPAALECRLCHEGEVSESKKNIPSMSICQNCHTGQNASHISCKKCHAGTAKILFGKGGIGIETLPSQMADLDCGDCHDTENKLQVTAEVCLDCHEEPLLEKRIRLQNEYTEKVASLKKSYETLSTYVKSSKGKQKRIINLTEFKTGEYHYKYLLLDRSKGTHNSMFTQRLMNEADKILSRLNKHYNETIQRLVKRIQEENSNISQKMGAMATLGEIGGEEAQQILIQALQDQDVRIRQNAVRVVGKFKGEKSLLALIGALKDPDPKVRQEVVLALGEIGGKKVENTLNQALKDPDFGVRWRAKTILKKLKTPIKKQDPLKKWLQH
jgi:hypothetical protein